MKLKTVKPLGLPDLEKLSTPRLLSYLKKLQRCENDSSISDWSSEQIAQVDGIAFKNSEQWIQQHKQIKAVLSKRPNVDRK